MSSIDLTGLASKLFRNLLYWHLCLQTDSCVLWTIDKIQLTLHCISNSFSPRN